MTEFPHIPYKGLQYNEDQTREKATAFYNLMDKRRSVRTFSSRPVDVQIMKDLIMTASTAPSGAHKQPWTFCLVSDSDIKKKIRLAAEKEEYDNYHGRMSEEWLEDLAPLGTDWHKEFLEIAPWLIVVFRKSWDEVNGKKKKNYYVQESVGIACGFLISAIHQAGLVTLTHTPSPMNFLERILDRPANEKAYLLLPVGYAADDATVPELSRKKMDRVLKIFN